LFLGDLIQRGTTFDTGIVKGDIETTVGCQDKINSCPDIGIVGKIGPEEGRGTTMLLDLGDDFASFFFAPAGQDDLGASVSESEGRCLADARRSSGYQSNFVFVGIGSHDIW
jgi:hypothetical protein